MQVGFGDLLRIRTVLQRIMPNMALNDRGENIFDNMRRMLEKSPPETHDLIITLFENMLVISRYEEPCKDIARQIISLFGGQKIILLPVCDAERKVKSGHTVHYEVKRFLFKDQFASIEQLDHPDSLQADHLAKNIVFVDDFVGTGSQIRKMVRGLEGRLPGAATRITVFCICAQAASVKRIEATGCRFKPIIIRPKAIRDKVAIGNTDPAEAYRLYNLVESHLSMQPYYKLGYSRSEALVCMKRPPNNTLPVFWHMKAKGSEKWPAPFPREL